MKTVLATAVLFCLLAIFSEAKAQVRYAIVAAENDIAVIINPVERQLKIGDKFYIIRRKGLEETALAIAKVERFKGEYCRVRITEKIIDTPPRQGDFLIDYDPTRYSPWGDNFDQPEKTPQTQPKPQQSPVFANEQSSSQVGYILSLFSGYGLSNFKGEDLYGPGVSISQSGYVPLGAQFLVAAGVFHFGAEINYAVMPFTFESKSSGGQVAWEDKLQQLQFGAVVRFNLMKSPTKPYIRAGAGAYTGDAKREYSQEFKDLIGQELKDETLKLDTNFGFNFGAGVSVRNGFIEFVYHLVERSYDNITIDDNGDEKTEKGKINADNWAVQIGFQLPLN